MEYIVLIILIIVVVILIFIISTITSNKKLKMKLEGSFGKEPANQDYDINSIDTYHQHLNTADNNLNWIDDITWNDLEMNKVFKQIKHCSTASNGNRTFFIPIRY